MGNHRAIALRGSTRFKDRFKKAQKVLPFKGGVAISVMLGSFGNDAVFYPLGA